MAKLSIVEREVIKESRNISSIPLTKIALYLEVILMVIQFIQHRKIIQDGKIREIKWWNFGLIGEIIKLFREIVRKLTDGEEG